MCPVNVDAEKKKISQLIIDAWKNEVDGNREALLDFFSDDIVWHMPGMPQYQGKDSLREFYEKGPKLTAGSSKPTVLGVSISGDFAYAVEQTEFTHLMPNGPVSVVGKGLDVFKKNDGVWKCVAIAVSSNESPMEED